MTGFMRKTGASVGKVRTALELSVLAVGAALGGSVGLGTVLYALSIGPLIQLMLPAFSRNVRTRGESSSSRQTSSTGSVAAVSKRRRVARPVAGDALGRQRHDVVARRPLGLVPDEVRDDGARLEPEHRPQAPVKARVEVRRRHDEARTRPAPSTAARATTHAGSRTSVRRARPGNRLGAEPDRDVEPPAQQLAAEVAGRGLGGIHRDPRMRRAQVRRAAPAGSPSAPRASSRAARLRARRAPRRARSRTPRRPPPAPPRRRPAAAGPRRSARPTRVVRVNSATPSSRSSWRIAALSGDTAMCSRSAARVKLSSSATTTKYRRWRSSSTARL